MEHFGNVDSAVISLVVLHDSGDSSSDSDAGTVQCVNVTRLCLGILFEADVCASCLVILKVGAGAYLNVAVIGRHPDLDIVGLCGAEADVTAGEANDTVGESESLQYLLSVKSEALELLVGVVGVSKLDKLDLVELVLTDKTSGISSCASRLGSEASGICAVLDGKILGVHDLVLVHVGYGNLGGRNEEIIGVTILSKV